ncbi:hypothetical protein VXE06_16455 [Klebsiella oxytoca]|uniref:hypothetical protein n=1 Tax=Klebsiella oxytoca TaxID=571 RepID=UPI0030D5595B
MRVIAAFSSDFREQYKADIFKVLSLPEGDVVHFRYKKKYVEPAIYQQRQSMVGRDVFIYFTQGNVAQNDQDKKLKHTSIRRAKIVAFDWSEMTELYHVRMELGDYINANIRDEGDEGLYFKYIECDDVDYYSNWRSRVYKVKDAFPDMVFYSIEGIFDSKGKMVIPKYNPQSKGCFYEVYHGDRYTVNLRLANLDDSRKKIFMTCNPDDVVISHCNPIESSVEFDDIFVPLNIKTVPFFKHSNFLSYRIVSNEKDTSSVKATEDISEKKDEEKNNNTSFDLYTVSQELSLRLNLKSALAFGFLCVMAFLAVAFSSDKEITVVLPYVKIAVSAILVFISTTGLFYFFNKK